LIVDVRLALVTDAALLAAIHQDSFEPTDQWAANVIRSQLQCLGSFGLVHAAGGMVLARVAADEAEILTLGVVEAARRRGVATALLRTAMQRAASSGAYSMFLEVSVTNQSARGLYAACGFSQIGVRRAYYDDGTDALVMRADLILRSA
jgi:[ribosomal protein S18]-alanine N-acetyltransferase